MSGAKADWFVDVAHGDFALNGLTITPVDAGMTVPEVNEDAARSSRVYGKAPDAGAFEFHGRHD